LKRGDLGLDLRAVHARLAGGHQLGLDFVDDGDGAADAGIGNVDLGGAKAERVLNGQQRLAVRAHRGGDRPIGRVVAGFGDTVTGGDARLRGRQRLVRRLQALQRGHRGGVGQNAGHARPLLFRPRYRRLSIYPVAVRYRFPRTAVRRALTFVNDHA
jgi:hypothetical protein